jgi:hypothetical protein
MKNLLTKTDLLIAFAKASDASEQYLVNVGESPINCGFAWVTVKNVRGKKLDLLKEFGFTRSYVGSGFTLWNPSQCNTQDMSAKYEGARVFAEYLQDFGINAQAEQRFD